MPERRAETQVRRVLADRGLLALRVAFGVVLIGHGPRKAFGAFNGPGHL